MRIVPNSKDFDAIRLPFSKTLISVLPPPTSITIKAIFFGIFSNENPPKISFASSSPDITSIFTPVCTFISAITFLLFSAILIAEVATALIFFTS